MKDFVLLKSVASIIVYIGIYVLKEVISSH